MSTRVRTFDVGHSPVSSFTKATMSANASASAHLEEATGLESKVTILGHVPRDGNPSQADRLLATGLGTAISAYIAEGIHVVMVAARGESIEPVPLKEIAGLTKSVPLDQLGRLGAKSRNRARRLTQRAAWALIAE